MPSLIELLGSQAVIDEARKMLTEVVEVAIAHALGDFELDEAKILVPIRQVIKEEVAAAFKQGDEFVDRQLKKVKISIGDRDE